MTAPATMLADTAPPARRLRYQGAARHLGISVSTLYVLVHRRQVPHFRLSKRLVVFDEADLDRWLDERRQE